VPVVAVLAVIALWYVSTHGKGTAPGRLVAWLVAAVVVWVMVDLQDPRSGGMVASGFASGIGQAVTGIGKFIGLL
jgi:hypothetical protein